MEKQMKVVKAALLGLGTVGSGVYKLIQQKEEFEKNRSENSAEKDTGQ